MLIALSALVFAGLAAMGILPPRVYGADMNGKNVTVNNGEVFWLTLPENPGTGYTWDINTSDGLVKLSDKYVATDRSGLDVGVGGTHTWEIKATKLGNQTIAGIYKHQADNNGVGREFYTLNVNVNEGGLLDRLLHLSFPLLNKGAAELLGGQPDIIKNLIRPGDNKSIMPTRPPELSPSPAVPSGEPPIPTTPAITGSQPPASASFMPVPTPIPDPVIGPPTPVPSSVPVDVPAPQVIIVDHKETPPEETVNARVGDTIRLSLSENPSTGYSWQLNPSAGLERVSDNYVQGGDGRIVGAAGTHLWNFKVTSTGPQKITCVYKRPWESKSDGEKSYVLNANVV